MRLKCFAIPALDSDAVTDEVSQFLASHRVNAIDRQLVHDGASSYWAICITYLEGGARRPTPKKPQVDYREVLSEQDFAVFSRLRNLRKQIADREGLPAYALFNNEHLATMVRDRIDTPAKLEAISGVGVTRVEKYGKVFLKLLGQLQHRGLVIKPTWQVGRSVHGGPLCGFRVLPHALRLSQRRRRRYRRARRAWESAYLWGAIDANQLQRGYAGALAITAHADARAWRRAELLRRPPPDV